MDQGYVDRSPRTKNERYLNDISRLTNELIEVQAITESPEVEVLSVGSTPIRAQVGASPLRRRHSLEIINDSSFLVYFGFSENMVVGVDAALINSGSSVTISLNPNRHRDVWVVSPDLTIEIKIIEVA